LDHRSKIHEIGGIQARRKEIFEKKKEESKGDGDPKPSSLTREAEEAADSNSPRLYIPTNVGGGEEPSADFSMTDDKSQQAGGRRYGLPPARTTEPTGLGGRMKEMKGIGIDEIVEKSEAGLDTVHDALGKAACPQDLTDVIEPSCNTGPIHTALAEDCKVMGDSALDDANLNADLPSADRMHQTAQPFSSPFAFKNKKEVLTLKRVTISSNDKNGPSLDP